LLRVQTGHSIVRGINMPRNYSLGEHSTFSDQVRSAHLRPD
jgi:hypothetical protein